MNLSVLEARNGMLWIVDSDPAPKILSEVSSEAQKFWWDQKSNGWPHGLVRLFCLARPAASTPPEFYLFAGDENGSSRCYYQAKKTEDIDKLNRYYEFFSDKQANAAMEYLYSLRKAQAIAKKDVCSELDSIVALVSLEDERKKLCRREALLAEEESARKKMVAGLENWP